MTVKTKLESKAIAPQRGVRARTWLAPVALLGAWLACGCNTLVNTSTEQCNSDIDCIKKGAEFAGTVCTAEKLCRLLPDHCNTSSDCTNKGAAFAGTVCTAEKICRLPADHCNTSSDCADKGAEFVGAICTAEKLCKLPPDYCDTNSDCTNKGAEFAGTICTAEKVCRLPPDHCKTSSDCTNKGAEFAGTICTAEKVCRLPEQPCTTSRECTARLEQPAWCRPDGLCTPVLTDECTEVVPEGALSKDEVILAGFMGPRRPPFATHGTPLKQGAALALEEIERANGLDGVDRASPRRHLAMLVCDDTPDDLNTLERPMKVARHLVDTVRVPIIIGPSKIPANAVNVIRDVTAPRSVLTLSPSITQAVALPAEQEKFFWRTVPSDTIQNNAWQDLSWLIAAALWDHGAVTRPQKPRGAYVARADGYGTNLFELFRSKLGDNPPGWPYNVAMDSGWDAIADAIVQANPEVLFAFSTAEFVTELLPRIEQRWPTAKRPYYMLFDGTQVELLLSEVERTPDLAGRILGTTPGLRRSALFQAFRNRYADRYGGEEPGNLAEFAYDAAYLFGYAVAGAKKRWPTGLDLANAMKNMSCANATKVEATPQTFARGATAAATTNCVNFDGASGALDFDNATREAPNDYALWCVGADPSGKLGFRNPYGGYYNVRTNHFTGWPSSGFQFCSAAPEPVQQARATP